MTVGNGLKPMKRMNQLTKVSMLCGAAMVAATGSAWAQSTTVTNTFVVNKTIPDGSASGVSDTHHLDFTGQNLFKITDLQVTLNISGGYNGDYYAYLVHDSGFAVLLNRPGRTSGNSFGYSDSGFNITLSDNASHDIHNYQDQQNFAGGLVTGTWSPDGRHFDPSLVLDTDQRSAFLSSFVDGDPSGDWTLFLADVDFGDQGTLVSWTLTVTAVPEPSTYALMGLGLGGLVLGRKWRKRF
jgi:subtilisin-like proprotein convertase family protein